MPILHYALGLGFDKVSEQNASKRQAKHEQNVSKTRAKHKQNTSKTREKREKNGLGFCPTHSVIYKHFLALGSCFGV